MAVKKPRKQIKIVPTPTAAANALGTSAAMAEDHPRPPPLPPGVYFSPTRKECLGFLNRWIAGDSEMPDVRGYIFFDDIYGASPDALRRQHAPSSTRAGRHAWWFLGEARFQRQSPPSACGGMRRTDRNVAGGGYWRPDQGKEVLPDEDGTKSSFRFYVGPSKKEKTPWLMHEFTSAEARGARKKGLPGLYRVYVTSHATDDELREIYGEDGVTMGPDGNKKPVRAMVPAAYFDDIAALLPPAAVRRAGQGQVVPPPPALPNYYGKQLQNFMGGASPVDVLGQYQRQQGQFLEADAPGQYQQQQGHFLEADVLDEYQQQQGQFSVAGAQLPPPAPPRLHGKVGEDAPSDNPSMSMAKFLEPADMVKGEPEWDSFDPILDLDDFANFDMDG